MTPDAARRGARPPGRFDKVVKPSVLGAFDGVVTVLGILFALAGVPHELVRAACGIAAAGAVSMGGAQFLADNEAGVWASVAMGATTGAGTLLPTAPYFVWPRGGASPAIASAALCLLAAAVIAWVKTTDGDSMSWTKAAVQTYSLMLGAGAVTLLCAWATGAVG